MLLRQAGAGQADADFRAGAEQNGDDLPLLRGEVCEAVDPEATGGAGALRQTLGKAGQPVHGIQTALRRDGLIGLQQKGEVFQFLPQNRANGGRRVCFGLRRRPCFGPRRRFRSGEGAQHPGGNHAGPAGVQSGE